MASSRCLRDANHHVIQQTDNDLAAQQAATDYALRKRLHELERALDELRWQKQQVMTSSCLLLPSENTTYCTRRMGRSSIEWPPKRTFPFA